MIPNDSVLNALASLCERVETSGRFPQEERKKAHEFRLDHQVLIDRHQEPSLQPEIREQIEAQAGHLGIAMVDFAAQLLLGSSLADIC